jgi:hypothetical protein
MPEQGASSNIGGRARFATDAMMALIRTDLGLLGVEMDASSEKPAGTG